MDINDFIEIDSTGILSTKYCDFPKININLNQSTTRLSNSKTGFFIEGGGTRGFYAIGIFKYLFEQNDYLNLNMVDIFGGTSVGSYFALALSLGYTKDEILDFPNHIDLSELVDSKYIFPKTLYRFFSKGYLYGDRGRENIVKEIINRKVPEINNLLSQNLKYNEISFKHLKLLIQQSKSYRDLLINAVDINTHTQVFMTTLDDFADEINLYDAVLASSAIPFVFQPTIFYKNSNNKLSYNKDTSISSHCLVDGGLCTNNPLDFLLLNNCLFENYNIWLLKFTNLPMYESIKGTIDLFKKVVDYLITGKNDIKIDLIHREYKVNTININSIDGTLVIYTKSQIFDMINDIYNKCINGIIKF